MSVYEEAWESYQRSLEVDGKEDSLAGVRYRPEDVISAMDIHLKEARRRAREEQKRLEKRMWIGEKDHPPRIDASDMKEVMADRRDLEAREIK